MHQPERHDFEYSPSVEKLELLLTYVRDANYIGFIKQYNGGYYYTGSLQLYSVSNDGLLDDIFAINSIIASTYKFIFRQLFSFGQDTFGNQFCFNAVGSIVFFNIETGEIEPLADSFLSWEKALISDLDYLTGVNLRNKYVTNNGGELKYSDRLCPKVPFVMGGEYEINNLYPLSLNDCLLVNYNIAKQVHDLPDGTPVILNTD